MVKYSERNMTYRTSHLLIGRGRGVFRGRVKKKYCYVRGGGGGHYVVVVLGLTAL